MEGGERENLKGKVVSVLDLETEKGPKKEL